MNKKAFTMVQIILGLVLILLLAVAFIRPLITNKTVSDSVDMSEIEKIAGAEEEKCRCNKGLLQGETQTCAKSKPTGFENVQIPDICKAWIDCNSDESCYRKV